MRKTSLLFFFSCFFRPPWSEHSASLSDSELADLFFLAKGYFSTL
ncbi:hypothetical protein PG_2104 [Porphyromonas gingivalis W83]|uniref:Uncharacterized protein n=1 Tax=Porphyromonas gingivalis (strain ATCC BAA-308 / W83) TaxID=242619 RepID=Q7MT77_PORGI|nr:hypothetical protein [Porphyromonas gingivalis]AAQ67063.1 hypothetical protein PG_2104 [Porphyromonas gingivalis W83]EIW94443.1 hypothetical protein HMPREF1322_1028 [Porphyromonas gingivalis W50]ERJ82364.1 hypothetical protein HMPREF1988_01677 [Porphyromonas gingivalis F0185]OWR76180.1 hypothetical protein SJDPG4_01915 [Porphyromonas gingivalis SJD4]OWR80410.1 hypothetical protein SJDPG11_03690 [Porphyromonas gingivalis SJD11]